MKDYDVKRERTKGYLIDYLGHFKEITTNTLEGFIYKYLKTFNRSSFYTNIKIYNDILKNDLNINYQFDSSMYVDKCVKSDEKNFFTKEEVINLCNTFSNSMDRFIVYALWHGISGRELIDLRKIKLSDIARDDSYIMINGEKFICDEVMQKYVRGTRLAYAYQTYKNGKYSYMEFNMENPYLLKTRCIKSNNNGMNIISLCSVQQRLMKLSKYYDEEYRDNIMLTARNLVKSGMLYTLHEKEISENIEWSLSKIEKYFKDNKIKMNAIEFYRTYREIFDKDLIK